ncbi:MFS transporter [Corynebacterium pseudodiphtheriticum]|uniref:MFS transporter n=1 Tax=Corynebacterium pseudodiphtheriticum TaxID=37637 RepID=UPI00254386CB|nr:MFS transporter [Corynebacterium pseudodiphtheriticum]MDK4316758.1 MFS transporter [Corynebacterium pseudodiphtheriticum]
MNSSSSSDGKSGKATASAQQLTRSQRLEQLPLTRAHGKLLGGSGIGWALDAMDVGLISFVMAALVAQWGLSPRQASWLGSIGFVGMAIGATLGGLLADKFGRRQVFAATLLIYGLATGASALAGSLAVLIILRFIVGLGLGAELPVASTYVAEFAPRSIRGRMVVILEAFWAVGWILAAVIGTFVVASGDNGWRWALALGCIPAIYGLVIRMALPESVRYLESRGKTREAEKVVQEFEDSPRLKWQAKRLPKRTDDVQEQSSVRGGKSIWSPSLRSRTRNLWIIWFCINLSYYGAFIWIPSLLHEQGFSLVKSFGFTLIITLAQLPGYAVAAWLIERWGRRATLATFLAGSAAAAGLYGFSSTEATIIIAGCLLSFFNLGAWGALYAIGPELYPTALRGTGTGAAAGFGRLASILAPLLVPVVLNLGGQGLLFALFGLSFAIAAVAAFQLPEQKGKQLR